MSQSSDFVRVEDCILCSSSEQHAVKGVSWKGVAFSYAICTRCGLKFMNPRPTQEGMIRFFKEDYWQLNMAGAGFPTVPGYDDKRIDQMQLRMPKYHRSYEIVSKHVEQVKKLTREAKFLEIGCAFGYTLEWLHRDFGCKVYGIEPSSEALKRCADAPAIEIVGRTAEEIFIGAKDVPQTARYDVIMFRHTLETLINPKAVLLGVREYLKDDGFLLIYTPNLEYYDLMSPFTPFVYTPETMTRMLAMSGLDAFKVIAPASPADRLTALKAKPNYEITLFARRAAMRDVVHPSVDVHQLLRTVALGNARSTWNQLSAKELILLLRNKVENRLLKR